MLLTRFASCAPQVLLNEASDSHADNVMQLAAQRGYYDVAQQLILACWAYTDAPTCIRAGLALDHAFSLALKAGDYTKCRAFVFACWLRNDVTDSRFAVYRAARMTVHLTKGIHDAKTNARPARRKRLEEEFRKAQLTLIALLQTRSEKELDDAFAMSWETNDSIFREIVLNDCVELLASDVLRLYLKRKWRGRALSQLITHRQYRRISGVTRPISASQWYVKYDSNGLQGLPAILLAGCPQFPFA